jgi:hypothetical protein
MIVKIKQLISFFIYMGGRLFTIKSASYSIG